MIAGKRVLIVEDEFLVAEMIAAMVEDAGAVLIGPAVTVAEALQIIKSTSIDLGVLDWNLQGLSGEPVAHELTQAGIPFVISTGYGEITGPFADRPVLPKPYPPELLVAGLASLLGDD